MSGWSLGMIGMSGWSLGTSVMVIGDSSLGMMVISG